MKAKQYLVGKTLTYVDVLTDTIITLITNSGSVSLNVDTTGISAFTSVNRTNSFSIVNDNLTANGITIDLSQTDIVNNVIITVPTEVTLWQLRAELKKRELDAVVETAIDSLTEPEKTIALEAWNRANVVLRNSITVSLIQQVLNMSSNEVDDIFIEAIKINA
jgi:hypothetical protein